LVLILSEAHLYVERSPIHHIEQIACPLILLQGWMISCASNQSHMIYEALRKRGLPVAFLTFVGEQHGFVKAENNIRALEAELYFYSRIHLLAAEVEPVEMKKNRVGGLQVAFAIFGEDNVT
jgi:dipeptidyl aminopeptidase/acylaminoacyl peptidase